MLFAQSAEEFSQECFQDPAPCYRGAPFWSWNTRMTKEMIGRQILEFKKMGMGGFHVHVRVGLKNRYLGDEFMELVRFCDEKAKENGMLCWLYDEDRYASGIAGGEVTKHPLFRARWLKLSVRRDEKMAGSYAEWQAALDRREAVRGCFLGAYDIVLESGYLKKAPPAHANGEPEGVRWYLSLEMAEETPWCNNQTYVDVMKREAVASFLQCTHERYAAVLQEEFGRSVPAIFTDEPHIDGMRLPEKAEGRQEILLPFTECLPDAYGVVEGKGFFEALPYIVWNVKGEKASPWRYRYYETLSELFADAYCGQIGRWCEKHGLISTGHLLSEDSMRGQVQSAGEAMRCYREFQMPGIDNLCDSRDFLAAKQASSIAHQYRKEGVLSESYGVTQWDFDFEGYKLAGDWQAALGVTVRVPHLAWASMNGESKRDYPAAIGWQSPWYADFSCIEDYFARIHYCLTRGKPVIRIGVLHTIESFWLLQGPGDQSEAKKKQYEEEFGAITKQLLLSGLDFDYIAESSLADETAVQQGSLFRCGEMGYQAVLVPSCISLRRTTLQRLMRFAGDGGCVLFLGETPEYVDCRRDETLRRFVERCEHYPAFGEAFLERLEEWREVELREADGRRTFNLLCQLREERDCRWLFIAQAYRGMEGRQNEMWRRRALHAPQPVEITLKGSWAARRYDALTGEAGEVTVGHRDGKTVIAWALYGDDSLLLRLYPAGERACGSQDRCPVPRRQPDILCLSGGTHTLCLPEPFAYRMSEPNVLLLDRFEYALDGEAYQESCEILRLDNRLRKRLGLPLRCEALAQPYVRIREDEREHVLRLRTRFYSAVALSDCRLALEEAAHCRCTLNGQELDMTPQGFYVDPAIVTVRLPAIRRGMNELCVTMDYGDCANPEWMYVLGAFGVELKGAHASLCPRPERLFWGDYTRQGFPFYTGNMTYLVELPEQDPQRKGAERILQVPYYAGAAVKASANGGKEQMLAFLPCACRLEGLKERGNVLEITCLGNRYNGFGQLHWIGDDLTWAGPNSWRTEGTSWTDTYRVKEMGILTAPLLRYC